MPPPKSKVQFSASQNVRKEIPEPTVELDNIFNTTANKKKSKKVKASTPELSTEEMENESYEEMSTEAATPATPITPVLIITDPDYVSDDCTSDVDVPPVVWPPKMSTVCATEETSNSGQNKNGTGMCNVGMYLTTSQKISPCLKSDDQAFSTTDYSKHTEKTLIPPLIHPINGQVGTFVRHREFTDYLRSSGFLRLFGECILSVYRMKTWPDPEELMEQILNAMGYEIPSRKQVVELNKLKESLILQLKLLTKERCQLLEKLDEYEDSAARYELLDQDDILPPRPENSRLNMELMSETFRNMQFVSAGRDHENAGVLKVIVSKPAPVSDTLPIPLHDKRMLH